MLERGATKKTLPPRLCHQVWLIFRHKCEMNWLKASFHTALNSYFTNICFRRILLFQPSSEFISRRREKKKTLLAALLVSGKQKCIIQHWSEFIKNNHMFSCFLHRATVNLHTVLNKSSKNRQMHIVKGWGGKKVTPIGSIIFHYDVPLSHISQHTAEGESWRLFCLMKL